MLPEQSILRLWLLSLTLLLCSTQAIKGDVFQLPEGLVSLEFVEIGAPANPPDHNGRNPP